MLKQIRLTNFKSFSDEEILLAPLTLLVGANAAGKSNLLEALWFLHGLTLGHLDVQEVLDGEEPVYSNGETWAGLRGGVKEASRFGTAQFDLQTLWELPGSDDHATAEILHKIKCRTQPKPSIIDESCGFATGMTTVTEAESQFSLLTHLRSESGGAALALGTKGPGLLQKIVIHPRRMRDYGNLKRPQLAADGSNLSGALYHLCAQPDKKQTLVDWLGEVLAPEIADIDFIEVEELGDVMAIFVEKNGTRISARSLSNGTLRFLGLLLYLPQAARGSTFLIEEIDSGLHPARLHVLMDFLAQVTRNRDLQIIATTHAPACLDAVDEKTLRRAVVCGRVPEHQGTILRRLGDLPDFPELAKQRGFSELFNTGWLEMAL